MPFDFCKFKFEDHPKPEIKITCEFKFRVKATCFQIAMPSPPNTVLKEDMSPEQKIKRVQGSRLRDVWRHPAVSQNDILMVNDINFSSFTKDFCDFPKAAG